MKQLDTVISRALDEKRDALAKAFSADVLAYYGEISSAFLPYFRSCLEAAVKVRESDVALAIVLNTPGGEVEAVEKMVEMVRHFYKEVFFIIPNMAMSAGTIFCMSGDKIYMDYSSSLGPIDPQVQSKEGKWVPALGYLDKFNEFIEKSAKGTLTGVEFAAAQNQDLAELRRYEQARDLSVSLLKDWLIKYKFRTWTHHRTDQARKGQSVTDEEKEQRANQIANDLGDNKRWHSHSRMIGINILRDELRLEIEDYGNDNDLRTAINSYHDLLVDYMTRQKWSLFMHGKGVF